MEKYWRLTKTLRNQENQMVVTDYLESLKVANLSESTIIKYRRFLEHFFVDLEESYSSLTPDQILKWLQENKGHLKETSYKLYLSIISAFYKFCFKESLIEQTPIKTRWYPRLPKSVPKYLENEEIAKVRQVSEYCSPRNQAIVEFMLASGCRVGEMHRLNIEDIDLENRTAQVLGKGKKIRHVHFTERCAVILERYLKTRDLKRGTPLFVTQRTGSRLSIQRIREIIIEIGESAGLSKKLTPHKFRHSFATNLLTKGAGLSFISGALGHSDLKTTQIYARLPNQAIISLYRKFMG